MLNRPIAQTMGKPTDPERIRSLAGDIHDVYGFIPVYKMGWICYSFKAPALVGNAGERRPAAILPAGPGMVDIQFPLKFSERPVFLQGFEFEENYSYQEGLYPPMAAVLSYRFARRDETGLPYYLGARVVIARTR